MKGLFITLEGIEGSGKTTQSKLLYEHLFQIGYDVLLTEEPGGTEIGLKIREILLDKAHSILDPITELLLYNASRAQHVREKIMPSMNERRIIICDRFFDSTIAYQGYGRGMNIDMIIKLHEISTGGLKPHITFLLDIDPEKSILRHLMGKELDRIELESIDFHNKVRKGYLEIARNEPERIMVINADTEIDEIHSIIINRIEDLIKSQNFEVKRQWH